MSKRRYLVVEESDVTTVLKAINNHRGLFGNGDTITGSCRWKDQPSKWFVKFYSSDRNWGRIAGELNKFGRIGIIVSPRGATELYYERIQSSN